MIVFFKKNKEVIFAFVFSLFSYLLFFGIFLMPGNYFWGDDAKGEYIPARTYFYEKVIQERSFPFWSERMFSGFPIYADLENSYLNPLNVLSILLFGPFWSYKFLHLAEYLVGSLSLFLLFKRKNIGVVGFVIANAVFYFNIFSLDHQIHFNIVMAFFLLPTGLLLADLFIEKKRLKYIVLESFVIANAVLWGHMQTAIIVSGGIFFYFLIFSWKNLKLRIFFLYFLILGFLVIAETLPQILPTYELYKSIGGRDRLNYQAGSLRPEMAIFSFVPYLLGDHNNFDKKDVGNSYTYNETYFYLGISSVFLFFLGLLWLKKNRLFYFTYGLVWIFLIFGFMSRNQLFSSHTPIVSLFRYWVRTVILASLGVGVLAGMFVDSLGKKKKDGLLKGLFCIVLPVIYLYYLKERGGDNRMQFLASFDYIRQYPYFPALRNIFLTGFFVLIFFLIWQKWKIKKNQGTILFFQAILAILVLFDLFVFSKDVMDFRIANISNYNFNSTTPVDLIDKRVVNLNRVKQTSMEHIYSKNWSPFGGSQFKNREYKNFFEKKIGSADVNSDEGKESLREAGVVGVIDKNGEAFLISNKKIDIIQNDLEGEYLQKKEGHIVLKLKSSTDVLIKTYLRFDSNWKVKINGKDTKIIKNGIFFDFPLKKGEQVVEIYYYPKLFVWGAIISTFMFFIFFLFTRNKKFGINFEKFLKN